MLTGVARGQDSRDTNVCMYDFCVHAGVCVCARLCVCPRFVETQQMMVRNQRMNSVFE